MHIRSARDVYHEIMNRVHPVPWKKVLYVIQILIAVILILYILFFINLNDFIEILSQISVPLFLIGAFCYFLNNVLMVYRLKRILGLIGHKIRLRFVFWSHMGGMILSDFSPFRSGYVYTAHSLNKRGIPVKTGLSSISSTFIYDLLFKAGVAFLGLLYFYTLFISSEFLYSLVLAVLVITSLFVMYFLLIYPPAFFQSLLRRNTLTQNLLAIGEQNRAIHAYAPSILIISLCGWILRGLQWFFIAAALHINFNSFLEPLFLSPLLTLFSFVPITPAGIGIQEAAIIGFFSFLGYSAAVAGTFALTIRFSEILVDLIGIRDFFRARFDASSLPGHYNAIAGDIDELAYSSDMLVQRFFQRRKTDGIVRSLHIAPESIVLDIGCGSGVQLAALNAKDYALAVGVDLSMNALHYASGKKIPRTAFIRADVQTLPIKEGSVDAIICAEIIEHLPDPARMIGEMKRVLKQGGEMVITTPNDRSVWGFYELLWDVFGRGRNYGETHLKFFTSQELDEYFHEFSQTSSRTLFFFSPLAALFNNQKILDLFIRFDKKFEAMGFGVSILYYARK